MELHRLRNRVGAKVDEWKDIVKIGRNNNIATDRQPPSRRPRVVGYEGMGLSDSPTILDRIEDAMKGIFPSALGRRETAVGTGINFSAPWLIAELAAAENRQDEQVCRSFTCPRINSTVVARAPTTLSCSFSGTFAHPACFIYKDACQRSIR